MTSQTPPSESLLASPNVAALYVDPKGVYANLPGVEVWDEEPDARLYDGPHPVVVHPPYFEHLTAEQRKTFIEKLNAGESTLREPGFFYRLPFFVSERDAE